MADLIAMSSPRIAADVSSGLAGLLANLLASQRAELAEPQRTVESEPEVVAEVSFMIEEEAPLPVARKAAPPPRLRHASYEAETPKRTLTSRQLSGLLDGLERVEPRPGEEGLPHAILLMSFSGFDERLEAALIQASAEQIQQTVRKGDIVVIVDDMGLALCCGGLFFPGDVEVMGARIRRRTIERLSGVMQGVEFSMVIAGALGVPNEDWTTMLYRAVTTLDQSVLNGRHDIIVEYGGNTLEKSL